MTEKMITATIPIFILTEALFSFIIFCLFIRIKIGMATAGNIHAWKAWLNTIRIGGVCFRKTEPNANIRPAKIRILYMGECICLGFPV